MATTPTDAPESSPRDSPPPAGQEGVRDERRRRIVAGALFGLGALAFTAWVVQVETGECNWASAIGSFDSTHGYTEGTEPSSWLFLASTILPTAGVAALVRPWWGKALLAIPVWLVVLLALFVVTPRPCHESNEPPVAEICAANKWKALDRSRFGSDPFSSRAECLRYFRSLGWP